MKLGFWPFLKTRTNMALLALGLMAPGCANTPVKHESQQSEEKPISYIVVPTSTVEVVPRRPESGPIQARKSPQSYIPKINPIIMSATFSLDQYVEDEQKTGGRKLLVPTVLLSPEDIDFPNEKSIPKSLIKRAYLKNLTNIEYKQSSQLIEKYKKKLLPIIKKRNKKLYELLKEQGWENEIFWERVIQSFTRITLREFGGTTIHYKPGKFLKGCVISLPKNAPKKALDHEIGHGSIDVPNSVGFAYVSIHETFAYAYQYSRALKTNAITKQDLENAIVNTDPLYLDESIRQVLLRQPAMPGAVINWFGMDFALRTDFQTVLPIHRGISKAVQKIAGYMRQRMYGRKDMDYNSALVSIAFDTDHKRIKLGPYDKIIVSELLRPWCLEQEVNGIDEEDLSKFQPALKICDEMAHGLVLPKGISVPPIKGVTSLSR